MTAQDLTDADAQWLAARWLEADGISSLSDCDLDALLGRVRRRMDAVPDRGITEHRHRWDQVEAVADALGLSLQGGCSCGPGEAETCDEDGCCPMCGEDLFHDEDGEPSSAAWSLCKQAAGWP